MPAFVVAVSLFDCESSGAMNEQGQSFGGTMMGLVNMYQSIFVHYLILLVLSNNFDLPWLFWFLFSTCWVFIVAELEDINKFSYYYKSIYTTLWK